MSCRIRSLELHHRLSALIASAAGALCRSSRSHCARPLGLREPPGESGCAGRSHCRRPAEEEELPPGEPSAGGAGAGAARCAAGGGGGAGRKGCSSARAERG